METKYQVIETNSNWIVKGLFPKIKHKRNFFGFPTSSEYDYNDLEWLLIDDKGWPIYHRDNPLLMSWPITFSTKEHACEFVFRLKKTKEVIDL